MKYFYIYLIIISTFIFTQNLHCGQTQSSAPKNYSAKENFTKNKNSEIKNAKEEVETEEN